MRPSRFLYYGPRNGVAHLLREFHQEVLVKERVHVRRENIEYPPVAEVDLAADTLTGLDRQQPRRQVQQSRSYPRHEDDHRSVQQQDNEHHGQQQEPEPEEDVRLLVDDVLRQNAEGVVLLYRTGATVLVEDALGDAREHVDHGVDPLLLRYV